MKTTFGIALTAILMTASAQAYEAECTLAEYGSSPGVANSKITNEVEKVTDESKTHPIIQGKDYQLFVFKMHGKNDSGKSVWITLRDNAGNELVDTLAVSVGGSRYQYASTTYHAQNGSRANMTCYISDSN